MIIDCAKCTRRPLACEGCVVTAMLEITDRQVEISEPSAETLSLLADKGLLPPLKYAQ